MNSNIKINEIYPPHVKTPSDERMEFVLLKIQTSYFERDARFFNQETIFRNEFSEIIEAIMRFMRQATIAFFVFAFLLMSNNIIRTFGDSYNSYKSYQKEKSDISQKIIPQSNLIILTDLISQGKKNGTRG